jgi:hypothetical protein
MVLIGILIEAAGRGILRRAAMREQSEPWSGCAHFLGQDLNLQRRGQRRGECVSILLATPPLQDWTRRDHPEKSGEQKEKGTCSVLSEPAKKVLSSNTLLQWTTQGRH